MSGTPDWSGLRAPSGDELEALARATLEDLPDTFRHRCAGLLIRVLDFADDDTLDALGIEDAFDLLGLFRGVGLAQGGGAESLATGQAPNEIHLYRRPILDYWADHDETLGHLVGHVLIHEIGHHFGLSDDDMERIEAETSS